MYSCTVQFSQNIFLVTLIENNKREEYYIRSSCSCRLQKIQASRLKFINKVLPRVVPGVRTGPLHPSLSYMSQLEENVLYSAQNNLKRNTTQNRELHKLPSDDHDKDCSCTVYCSGHGNFALSSDMRNYDNTM